MWPYFNVPLEGHIRQVWLYYYLRWYDIYHNCCPVHISFIIWLIVTDYLCHKWPRVSSSVSQMTTSMFLRVTNDHEYVPLCHKWPRVCFFCRSYNPLLCTPRRKLKIEQHESHWKPRVNPGAPERKAVPAPHVAPVVLLFLVRHKWAKEV